MAGGYRKKRRIVGPSKNEEKVARGRQEERRRLSAQTLEAALPDLLSLAIEASFFYPAGNLLDKKRSDFNPPSTLSLAYDCPGRCGRGRFDLEDAVHEAVASGQDRLELSLPCPEEAMAGPCGCELKAVVSLKRKPA